MLGAARTKQRRLLRKLEDRESKVLGSQKSASKSCSKDPLSHTFVNILVMDFDLCLVDSVKIVVVFSSSLSRCSTLVSSV
jgi:hypothetical protein